MNADQILLTTTNGDKIIKTVSGLDNADRAFIEALRDEIASANGADSSTATAIHGPRGQGDMMMSSSSGDSSSETFSSASSSFSSLNSGIGSSSNGLSVTVKDGENFSVAKSDLPFGWSRVFYSGDLVTLVSKNGEVRMLPLNLLDSDQKLAINNLRTEVKNIQRAQAQQLSNTVQHSMDMVSNVFNSIMGRFPKPPDYSTAVGNTFGNNFPFGPNNSPFTADNGWPFSSGTFAYAGLGR